MGNYVRLELRGSGLPILAEEDEEAVIALECDNGLPLFWLALIQEKNLSAYWEGEVRATFADPDEFPLEPLRLSWQEARANLASACKLAEARLPDLFPLLRTWAEALEVLARQGPTEEVRFYLPEYTNFHEDADGFLDELRRCVRFWHGAEQPNMPPIKDIASELTGVGWHTGAPFPAALPIWRPGRPVPGSSGKASQEGTLGRAPGVVAEWCAVLLVAVVILGAALLGAMLFGSTGMIVGGLLGLIGSVVTEWKWEKRNASRRS